MFTLEELSAIEEIKQLKSQYFHFVDTRRQDLLLEQVFAEDCTFHLVDNDLKVDNPRDFLAMQKPGPDSPVMVHQGHDPFIEILGPDTARGRWAVHDLAQFKTPRDGKTRYEGFGYYHETYTKTSKGWRIQSWKVQHTITHLS